MKQSINRRLVNKVALRLSQCLLVAVFWAMTYSIVKAFEQNERAISVLQYHHVSEQTPFLTSIKPEAFEAHLDYLVQENFQVISLSAFLQRIKTGALTEDKTAVITFDDAYASIYETAWPLLKERGFPFSVFVNTQAVDQKFKHSMSWSQMKEMAVDGVEFANHTHSHLHLIRKHEGETKAQWLARIRGEIEQTEALLEEKLGQSHKALAYPFGEYNPEVMTLLEEMGYVGFAQHSGAVGEGVNLQAIPRFPFGGYYSDLDDFITKVNALALPVGLVKLGVSSGEIEAGDVLDDLPHMDKEDWLYLHDEAQPAAYFEVPLTVQQSKRITCYASGQGRVPLALVGQADKIHGFLVETVKDAPVGRSRFNCTLPSQWSGRFYWVSQPVIRLAANNQWYPE
ncbi:polysaccharide deacetylase family protein [Litoribrevibacter albus]|uniref:Polysaccharide deacetylase n=1 Tax=Litoribrevibacter albus TaxID=1473156 RepID=A0AA37S5P7_9GAMM|nr:polysaccharide deacetylase family protein [Litoribrevibacter albus]GLQ29736.1 polysaccharide deacetylase [Litoribrevibacter albus]